jgi:hypothetical protein
MSAGLRRLGASQCVWQKLESLALCLTLDRGACEDGGVGTR